ncbi:vitellogenin 1-like [Tropilaelaps mercedesae]|uniref:Vitellogenin 1-like n=1 Tax=Tropilaelaps mercedesae TaxID=418985 RepID=A0A1V9XEW8_9ACAR|nr:vitellogenin 1-like [Tropilaelaps mercedesae]
MFYFSAQRIRAAWAQIRPFDFGMWFSHLRSESYYNPAEDYGFRGIWKMIASNTTVLPGFTQARFEHVHGPFMQTLFGAKLLVKGGDRIWQQIVGKDGLLSRISQAVEGQIKAQALQQGTRQLLVDIAQGMDNEAIGKETPKAVLFWRLFSGEAIIPMDAEYVLELKNELLQTTTKLGKGGVSGHFVRLLVPTKAFYVEPTPIGFPVVHSVIHPVVISVRYQNIKLAYDHQEGSVVPHALQVTGTIQPTVLSFRQSRTFVAEMQGQMTPTMKVTDLKELNLQANFRIGYEHSARRFRVSITPQFDRIFHTGLCTELKLDTNTIIDSEPGNKVVDYGKCIKSMQWPLRSDLQMGGLQTGMVLRLMGESHQPWAGFSTLVSKNAQHDGLFGAPLWLLHKGMKHHACSLYLEADKQMPVNEWAVVIDMDSNVEQLAKMAVGQQTQQVQQAKVQYQARGDENLGSELQEAIRKVEQALEKADNKIDETTVEEQALVKIEGRYKGQPKRTIKVAMKKIYNFGKTEQRLAVAAEQQESRRWVELFGTLSYPRIGSPLRYNPTSSSGDERMNGTLLVTIQDGQQEQVYRMNLHAVKSEEQGKNSEHEWFETRCIAEQSAGWTQTDACKKAILKDNSLDRMEMTIEIPNNADPMAKDLAYKVLDMMKYQFYPKMQSEIASHQKRQENLRDGKQEIRIFANAVRNSPWSLLYDVHVETPQETTTFSKISLPGVRPIHMQLTAKQQLENMLSAGQGQKRCVLGDEYVRTYDNVTFGLDVKQGCEYVLTRDQSEGTPDFTVTFKVVEPATFGKIIRIQLSDALVEFYPFGNTERYFKVGLNGQVHKVTFGKPIMFSYGHGKQASIQAQPTGNHVPILIFSDQETNFGVEFDGQAAAIYVDGYKGQTNGICGTNDNEQAHEFIGPHGHEYTHANEFIASYGIGNGCKTPAASTNDQQMAKLNEKLKQIRLQEMNKKEQIYKDMQLPQASQPGQQRVPNQHWNEQLEEQMFSETGIFSRIQPAQKWEKKAASHDAGHMHKQDMDQEDRQVLRTSMTVENGKVCFSVQPVPTCKPGYHKQGVLRTERVESICLERNNEAAIQAVHDIRNGNVVDIASLEPYQKGRHSVMVNVPRCMRYD